jgi:hypothetical protein
MNEENIVLGPIVYAALKGLKAYKEAESVYKDFPAGSQNNDLVSKLLSSFSDELRKFSDVPAQDFLKKYQRFESIFSLALKLLG